VNARKGRARDKRDSSTGNFLKYHYDSRHKFPGVAALRDAVLEHEPIHDVAVRLIKRRRPADHWITEGKKIAAIADNGGMKYRRVE